MFGMFAVVAFAVPMPDTATLPPACDIYRFPPRCVVTAARQQNERLRKYLIAERELWGGSYQELFEAVLTENEQLYRIWDAIDWAQIYEQQGNFDSIDRQRNWLGRLRTMLGIDDYNSGTLPPAVPVWRFRELK